MSYTSVIAKAFSIFLVLGALSNHVTVNAIPTPDVLTTTAAATCSNPIIRKEW